MWNPKNKLADEKLRLSTLKIRFVTSDPETKATYTLQNNALHQAIINNDNPEAIRLININKNKTFFLNKQSLLNTPLILALKHGNIEIAKYLLTHSADLDINMLDSRGLTALDWACMLRQNELIKMLLLYKSSEGFYAHIQDEAHNSHSQILYGEPVSEQAFTNYLNQLSQPKIKVSDLFTEPFGKPLSPIENQQPYSDLRFYMKDVCINLGWMDAKDFPSSDNILQSHELFHQYFVKGYKAFCTNRNEIEVDPKLLAALKNYDTYQIWLVDQESPSPGSFLS